MADVNQDLLDAWFREVLKVVPTLPPNAHAMSELGMRFSRQCEGSTTCKQTFAERQRLYNAAYREIELMQRLAFAGYHPEL